ncbi:MAG: hypothetical protein ACYTEP_05220 [Planctomycetota bacterium]|jgi:hypothetical protein
MKTLPLIFASGALALAAAAPAAAQSGTMPDLTGATWLNSPPLSAEDFEGRAVLVEVFRTW